MKAGTEFCFGIMLEVMLPNILLRGGGACHVLKMQDDRHSDILLIWELIFGGAGDGAIDEKNALK